MRRLRRTAFGLATSTTVLGVFALLAVPTPAQARTRAGGEPRRVSYAALGDSFSAGAGTRPYDLAGAPCLRSSQSYATLWAQRRSVRAFTFLACSGATTADAVRRQVPHIPRDADLVTLTLGGNDTGFGPILLTCTTAPRDAICAAAVRLGETAAVTTTSTGLAATVALVKHRAPQARVVVLGYPRLFEPGSCAVAGIPTERRRALMNRGADVLDRALSTAARAAGATFVDVRARFAGHGVCAPPDRAWINGPGQGPGAYHPNAAGQVLGYLPALAAATSVDGSGR